MYYQPLGYRHLEYSDVDPEEVGICTSTGSETLCQEGFKEADWFRTLRSLKQKGLISEETYQLVPCNRLLLPDITFPEGFDYEKYFKIQYELSNNCLFNSRITREAEILLGSPSIGENNVYSDNTYVFDRSLLPTIVSKYYGNHLTLNNR